MDSWIRKRYANTLANPKTPKHCTVFMKRKTQNRAKTILQDLYHQINITSKNNCNASYLKTLQAMYIKMYSSFSLLLATDCTNFFSLLAIGFES